MKPTEKLAEKDKLCKNLSISVKEKEKTKIFEINSKNVLTKREICDNIKSSKEKSTGDTKEDP